MHVLKNTSDIKTLDGSAVELPAGEWLMTDDNAFKLAVRAEMGTATLRWWHPFEVHKGTVRELHTGAPLAPIKSILLIRSGAIGDLLLLSPAIVALRAKYPDADIALACHQRHHPIIADFPIDGRGLYPLPANVPAAYDLVISLEYVVELSTQKGVHATDAYAEALGVTVTDYKPVYKVTEFEKSTVLLRTNKPRVALQLHASSIIRNYPVQLWLQVIQTLVSRGWEIMLIGSQDAMRGAPDAIKDCSKLTFREAAAVLESCDVFCGVDSSFFNLCPALGVPAIGLFGPVDWKTRVKGGKNYKDHIQSVLHGEAPCAPCGWTNSRAGVKFPPHGPCAKTGFCQPLSEIKPDRIVSLIEREAKK